jgi:hypothetical protein
MTVVAALAACTLATDALAQGRNGAFERRMARENLIRRAVAAPQDLPWAPDRLNGVVPGPAAEAALRDLDAAEFAVRERASLALRGTSVRDEEVFVLLSRSGLSEEQRARLVEVATRRIVDAPRGALGIQMDQRIGDDSGVSVTGIIRGMPAEGVLKPGDRIVEINDQPVFDSSDLVDIVQNMRPGDRVRLVVMRGERDERGRVKADQLGRVLETRVELEMPLGATDDLERRGNGPVLSRPTDGRREQLATALRRAFPRQVATLTIERRAGEDLDVESHPDIVEARRMLARPRDPTLDAGVYGMLQARLTQLEAASRAPNLSPGEKAWLEAVVARYRELAAQRQPSRAE